MLFVYYYKYLNVVLYVGSTGNIQRRKDSHKCFLKNGDKMPFYKYLREHSLTFDELNVTVLEAGNVDKTQLLEMEKKTIYILKPLCNVKSPIRTEEELKEDRKDNDIKYREANRENINEKAKDNDIKYRETNKVEINEKKKVKVHCDSCNVDIRKTDISIHKKTKKHLQNSK